MERQNETVHGVPGAVVVSDRASGKTVETRRLCPRRWESDYVAMIGDSTDHVEDWDVTHSYDRSAELPSEVIVRAVAGTTNRGVCSIDPLFDAIEPDALDSFIGDGCGEATWLSFSYEGCRVYVDGRSVSVTQIDPDVAE